MRETSSQFRSAVEASPALTLKDGLQALRRSDREKIRPDDPHFLTGSVNIDKCLEPSHPNENRWDYAVGYKDRDGQEKTYFIEVHPANTSNVAEVIGKAKFLKNWAAQNAPELWNMTIPREIHWVASGRINIPKDDRRIKQLSKLRIDGPQKVLTLT